MKPCITCGEPSTGSYCGAHEPAPWQHREGSARDRGYSTAWDRLSRRARRMQPFCSDCNGTADLQTDHTPAAWARFDAGLPIRLQDVAVVCASCNRRRGSGRDRDQGESPVAERSGPREKPQSRSLTAPRDSGGSS